MKRALLMMSVTLAMSACFSLSRETPLLSQYVLGGAPAADRDSAPANAAGATLGVRRLDLMPYLASPAIVVRRGAHQMVTSDFQRWGEDPVAGINRAFASHLAATPQVRAVDVAPWPVRSRHDFLVQLHISRFEGVVEDSMSRQGAAHLLATWELSRPEDGQVVARGRTDHRADGWRPADYAGLVALLDDGLKHMAGQIVQCVGRVAASAEMAGAADQSIDCAH